MNPRELFIGEWVYMDKETMLPVKILGTYEDVAYVQPPHSMTEELHIESLKPIKVDHKILKELGFIESTFNNFVYKTLLRLVIKDNFIVIYHDNTEIHIKDEFHYLQKAFYILEIELDADKVFAKYYE